MGTLGSQASDAPLALANLAVAAANSKLLGSGDAGIGLSYAELTLGTNLSMSGNTLNASGGGISDGDKGDITVSASGATWTIDDNVVTEAKLSTSDNTTANATTLKHGLLPKLSGNANTFLDGSGAYSSPAGGSDPALSSHVSTGNTTITAGKAAYITRYYEIAAGHTIEVGALADIEIG